MRKNSVITFSVAAIIVLILLILWFALGFNYIDNPLDLVCGIVVILVFVICAYFLHRDNKQWIQACRKIVIYEDDTFQIMGGNSSYYPIGIAKAEDVEDMFAYLKNANYSVVPYATNYKCKTPKYMIITEKYNNNEWSGYIYDIEKDKVKPFSENGINMKLFY